MSDDGNFQLLNFSSDPIWQSFDHPTDTLLPGQVFKLLLNSEFYILFCSKFICMFGSHNNTYTIKIRVFMLDVADDSNVLLTSFRKGDPAYNILFPTVLVSESNSFDTRHQDEDLAQIAGAMRLGGARFVDVLEFTIEEKDRLRETKKNDVKALFIIQQVVHETIFSRIVAATTSKQVLRSLTPKFDHVVAAIEEAKDLSILSVDELMGSLQAHEARINRASERNEEKALQVRETTNHERENIHLAVEVMEEEDFAASMAVVITGVDGEVMDKDNSMNKGMYGFQITKIWGAMIDPCLVNTVCGLNGLCISSDNDTVTCDCLPGFVHLDPTDAMKGCRPKTVDNYRSEDYGKTFEIQVINDVDIGFPPAAGQFSVLATTNDVDVEGCKQAILGDRYAMAATLNGRTCLSKRTPLMNARNTSNTKGLRTLIKVPSGNSLMGLNNKPKDKSKYRKFLEIGNIIAGVLAFCFGVVALFSHPITGRLSIRKQLSSASAIGINFREFTYQELDDATNGFDRILGRGSFGKVYGGNLHIDGVEVEIAVKVLDKMHERTESEFVTELTIIGRTYHKNLVRLLGYCIEKENQFLLVFELMPRGALSSFLFGSGEKPNWAQRVEIALGIARGLAYLHEGCEMQIIHCDVKPKNVLLDPNYTTKIADFGISKLLMKNQTRTNTEARGTFGYMAPEWLRGAPVTAKVDVFSYGVMLLEIICRRRNVELDRVEEESEEEDLVLSNWVLSCAAAGKLETVVGDEPETLRDLDRFERMAMVGLWCIHPDASQRPSMKKVTQMLEGTADVGTPPQLLRATTSSSSAYFCGPGPSLKVNKLQLFSSYFKENSLPFTFFSIHF
ncbi:LOW QUALITY PROTEIN: G-type lectin S-receptor-like serine/threonine-protein kinase LECRK4 [Cucurbita maxima]|uniref:non-specific serine/threonine protein kinase n=1 Tax=Cucurbita maxima TaxID=3661 RepID=A0A6J1ITN2_CUCMA|nr:LOW QUALITY PROTEIN: G-type lectin S-receptor-like serine/threonine-protein kinase LECRK4 [Cucurbita maxima]